MHRAFAYLSSPLAEVKGSIPSKNLNFFINRTATPVAAMTVPSTEPCILLREQPCPSFTRIASSSTCASLVRAKYYCRPLKQVPAVAILQRCDLVHSIEKKLGLEKTRRRVPEDTSERNRHIIQAGVEARQKSPG